MLDDATINKIADAIADRLKAKEPSTMKFDEARYALFHGKSRDWIKYYILRKYPEVLVNNGGWITKPEHRGVRIKVLDVKAAKKWLSENTQKIDWNAPEPITLKRKAGLAKPIKRSK
ncbi:DUF771 domain-containing protein [Limosilactobacillus agrestimuris]|uniref:DUF771 domain-containing protein n=1 Tax=Limosilactobacillus agrestimuris TaxID=2941331 RepID=UPI0020400673|nr:DUF771 domain-containing protein [Limosilactobacillus agrestimuris]